LAVTFSDASNSLIRLLLDPLCPGCRRPLVRPLDRTVCDNCWDGVSLIGPPLCARCGDQLAQAPDTTGLCTRCARRTPAFSLARSAGAYEGSLRELVHAFKFEGRRQLAEPLARLMCRRGLDVLEGADAVVPVPLHPVRLLRRGFNQADDLAREIGLPVWRLLRRRRHGPPQASLPAPRRRANLKRAYALSFRCALPESMRRSFAGKIVVLIDDVMTTGATLDACARTLLDHGVRDVRALTVARAVVKPPHPPPAPRPPWGLRRR
jgi:ComF family protein